MVFTMNAILPIAHTYTQERAEYVLGIVEELYWSADIMDNFVTTGVSDCEYR